MLETNLVYMASVTESSLGAVAKPTCTKGWQPVALYAYAGRPGPWTVMVYIVTCTDLPAKLPETCQRLLKARPKTTGTLAGGCCSMPQPDLAHCGCRVA